MSSIATICGKGPLVSALASILVIVRCRQEPMPFAGGVCVPSHNVAGGVDTESLSRKSIRCINRDEVLLDMQEPVDLAGCVYVETHNASTVVDPEGPGLKSAWHIDLSEASVGKQEPMEHAAGVVVRSHNAVAVVNPEGSALTSAGRIDRTEVPMDEHKPMNLAGSILVQSNDVARVVDPEKTGLESTGDVDRAEAPHGKREAMDLAGDALLVASHNLPRIVDSVSLGLDESVGSIYCANDPLGKQEPVDLVGSVLIPTHDLAGIVHAARLGCHGIREINRSKCIRSSPLNAPYFETRILCEPYSAVWAFCDPLRLAAQSRDRELGNHAIDRRPANFVPLRLGKP